MTTSPKVIAQIMTHEMAHYAWVNLLSAKDQAIVKKLCATDKAVEPTEQHASAAEFFVHGSAQRLNVDTYQGVRSDLLAAMLPYVKPYFKLRTPMFKVPEHVVKYMPPGFRPLKTYGSFRVGKSALYQDVPVVIEEMYWNNFGHVKMLIEYKGSKLLVDIDELTAIKTAKR